MAMISQLLSLAVIVSSVTAFSVSPSLLPPSSMSLRGTTLKHLSPALPVRQPSGFCRIESELRGGKRVLGMVMSEAAWVKKTPAEVREMMKKGYTYLDIRTEKEFSGGHPEGAVHFPAFKDSFLGIPVPMIADFVKAMETNYPDKNAKLLVGCASGKRSTMVCETLSKAGYTGITENESGFFGWRDAGLPVSLE